MRLAIALIALLLALPAAAGAKEAPSALPGRYIVVYRVSAGDVDAATSRRERTGGFHARHRFRNALRGFAARLSDAQVRRLRADADVASVTPDRPVHALAAVPLADGEPVPPTGVRRVGAATTTATRQAADVGVAVVDTGIDLSHPDLAAVDATNCVTPGASAQDDEGHGTHVAGTIAARNNGAGVVGVAPGTPVYAVKVLDSTGGGTWSDVICGLDWVAGHAAALNIHVANMSLGGLGSKEGTCGTGNASALHQAVCNVVGAHVSVVVAAGNDAWDIGDNPPDVPATYPEVLTVTAMSDSDGQAGASGGAPPASCGPGEADDVAASFSNFATRAGDVAHLIAAPGVCIRSTLPGGAYGLASGTSMSTPHVSGAVALCLGEGGSAGPCVGMTPAQIIGHMRGDAQAADPASGFSGDPAHPFSQGQVFGYLVRAPAPGAAGAAGSAPPAGTASSPAPPVENGSPAPAATDGIAPPDLVAPFVSIAAVRQRLGAILRAGLRLPLRCSERCAIVVRLVLDGPTARRVGLSRGRPVTIGRAALVLRGGRTTIVTVRLTAAARRRLAGVRSVTVSLRTAASDLAGNRRSGRSRLTLRR